MLYPTAFLGSYTVMGIIQAINACACELTKFTTKTLKAQYIRKQGFSGEPSRVRETKTIPSPTIPLSTIILRHHSLVTVAFGTVPSGNSPLVPVTQAIIPLVSFPLILFATVLLPLLPFFLLFTLTSFQLLCFLRKHSLCSNLIW